MHENARFFLTSQTRLNILHLKQLKRGSVRDLKVTLKQIADIAGVSRGTVDRAIHNREGVNPQVRERILTVAQSLGYTPNIAGKQLSARKLHLKLGMILPPRRRGFWEDVYQGLDAVQEELSDYGVTVLCRSYEKYSAASQLSLIDQLLEEGVSGLAIAAVNHVSIQKRLNGLMESGLPVVVVNSEIEHISPLCYVGADYLFSGRTAAGILGLIAQGRHVELTVFTGTNMMLSHTNRITGFLQELTRLQVDCHLIDICKLFDSAEMSDEQQAYKTAVTCLRQHPETTAVFTAAGPVQIVARAIRDTGMLGKVVHFSFDLNTETLPGLQDGSLTAVIGQESFKQGYQPIKLLFDYLVNGVEPQDRRMILQNEIFIQQNAFLR